MIVLTPIGLLAPGGAFGEDAPQHLDLAKYHLSAVPTGLNKFSSFWSHAVLGGYGFHAGDHPVIGYLVSALVGIVFITVFLVVFIWVVRLIMGRRGHEDDAGDAAGPQQRPPVTV
jgi:cobalt/nickel transport system permease protein